MGDIYGEFLFFAEFEQYLDELRFRYETSLKPNCSRFDRYFVEKLIEVIDSIDANAHCMTRRGILSPPVRVYSLGIVDQPSEASRPSGDAAPDGARPETGKGGGC